MKRQLGVEVTQLTAVQFIAYCAVTCNGSSDVQEICRRVCEAFLVRNGDPDLYGILRSDDLYASLYNFSTQRMFSAAVSCRHPRHTYNAGGLPFVTRDDTTMNSRNNIMVMQGFIEKCHSNTCGINMEGIRKHLMELQGQLETLPGIGPFNVHHVIHLSAFLGLLPLKCLRFASLLPSGKGKSDGRGPVQFIRKTCFKRSSSGNNYDKLSIDEVQQIFQHTYHEIREIVGNSSNFDESFLENMLCELNRILDDYSRKMHFTNTANDMKSLSESVVNELISHVSCCFSRDFIDIAENEKPGTYDIMFLDTNSCKERRFLPMFHTRHTGGRSNLYMVSHILRTNGSHFTESIRVTDWGKENEKQHLWWERNGREPTLFMSDFLHERIVPRLCIAGTCCQLCNSISLETRKDGFYVRKVSQSSTEESLLSRTIPHPTKRRKVSNRSLKYPSKMKGSKQSLKKYMTVKSRERTIEYSPCATISGECTCQISVDDTRHYYLCPEKWIVRDNYDK